MTPFWAALSRTLAAWRTASTASAPPFSMTCLAFATNERAAVRTGLLRKRFLSDTRMALRADLVFANTLHLLVNYAQYTIWPKFCPYSAHRNCSDSRRRV